MLFWRAVKLLKTSQKYWCLHNVFYCQVVTDNYDGDVCIPPRLHLSSENIDRHGVYLIDCADSIYIWVGKSVSDLILQDVFGCKSFNELPDCSVSRTAHRPNDSAWTNHLEFKYDLPELENPLSERIRTFVTYLLDSRPFGVMFMCFKLAALTTLTTPSV